jgi:hypothetical protein
MTPPIVHVLVARTRLTGNLRIGAPRSGALRVTTTAERLLRAASSRIETAFTWTLNLLCRLAHQSWKRAGSRPQPGWRRTGAAD